MEEGYQRKQFRFCHNNLIKVCRELAESEIKRNKRSETNTEAQYQQMLKEKDEELRETKLNLEAHRSVFFNDSPESLLNPWKLAELLSSGIFSEEEVEKIASSTSVSLLRLQLIPRKKENDFELVEKIGEGGFGIVHKGISNFLVLTRAKIIGGCYKLTSSGYMKENPKLAVAIKTLLPGNPGHEKLLEEGVIGYRLFHPNIVETIACCIKPAYLCLGMPFIGEKNI
jgi:hypothetical protein